MKTQTNRNKLLLITGLFFFGSILSDIFVNVYIFRLKSDFFPVVRFLIATYAVIPFIFYLSGFIGRKTDRVSLYRLGIVFFIIFYLVVILLRENVTSHLLVAGALKGIAMGFYWFGFHVLTFDYTSSENRDSFFANFNMIVSGSAMTAPLISGFVITRFPALTGYYAVFICSASLFVAAILFSASMKSTPIKRAFKMRDLIFTKNKKWGRTMLAYFAMSGKDAIAMFLIALLVYRETQSEFTLGKFMFLISALTITTSFFMGKFSGPHNRHRYVLGGAVLCFFSAFLILYKINFTTLLIYGIITAVSDALFKIPLSAYAMDIMNLDENPDGRKMDYIAARDVPIAAGRIITLLIFIFLLKKMDANGIKAVILLISTFPFVIYWAMYRNNSK